MPYIKNANYFKFNFEHSKISFIYIIAIAVALLAGVMHEIYGDVFAILMLLLMLFVTVATINYRIGILVAVTLLPLGSTTIIPREMFGITGLNPLNATLLFSAMSLAISQHGRFRKSYFPKWPRYFWLYLGVFGGSALYGSINVQSIPGYFKVLEVIKFDSAGGYLIDQFLKPLLIVVTAFLFSIIVKNARQPKLCLIPLFFSAAALPVIVIIYIATSGVALSNLASSDSRGFLSVTGMHANELGLMFNITFALALFSFCSAPKILEKWTLGIISALVAIAVALTFSRGAYLGLLAVVLYLLITQSRIRTTFIVLLLVAMATLLMPESVLERALTGVVSGNVEDISAGRVDGIWRPLLPDLMLSPIVGHGLGSILWSEAAQHRAILPVGHPHSAYLGALLDLGIAGTLIVVLFFWHMWRVFKTLAEQAAEPILKGFFRGAMACILLILVQGVTDDSFMPRPTQAFVWLSYGLAIGLIARANCANALASSINRIV